MPFELPQGWVWCRLDDTCQIFGRIGFRGYTKEDLVEKGKGAITLSPSNIINNCMNYDNCTYISWAKYEESPEIKVENNDILLVKTGSSFGKCALVLELPFQATINPQFVVLKSITIHRHYLTHVLQSQYAREVYDNFVLGTAIPTFTQVALGNMRMPLPPFAEQQRIVDEVERWFKLIDTIEQGKADLQTAIKQAKNKILELAISGKLVPQDPTDEPASELLKRINPKAHFTCDNEHYPQLPKGWVTTDVKSVATVLNGFAFKSANYIQEKGMRIIRIANVQDGFIEDNSPQYYPLSLQHEYQSYILKYNDMLMSLTGNVGRVGLLPKHLLPAALNQRVACIREIPSVIEKLYLYYLFRSQKFIKECISSGKGVAQLNISTEWLKYYQIYIPPLAEQKRIVKKVEELFFILDTIEESL